MRAFRQWRVVAEVSEEERGSEIAEHCWAQGGFTLMEVMVVMAIIGILASIAVPAYQRYTAQAHLTSAMGALRGQQLDVEQFMMTGASIARYALETPEAAYGTLSLTEEGAQPALHYRFHSDVSSGLSGGDSENVALHMVRKATGGWECHAEGVQARLVPSECQSS